MGTFDPTAVRHGEELAPGLIVHLHDLRTLQNFYEVTNGPLWANSGGWKVYGPAGDPCSSLTGHGWPSEWPETSKHYYGTGCRSPCDTGIEGENCQLGRISRLELPTNRLSGTLPPSLATLNLLSILDLGGNRLSGTLPTELGLLERVERLNLNDNSISGTIPTQLGTLGNNSLLTTPFDIATGSTGSLYRRNPLARRLHQLNLHNNRISGAIPTELGVHSWLQDLKLGGNTLLGTPLPKWNLTMERFNYTVEMTTGDVAPACDRGRCHEAVSDEAGSGSVGSLTEERELEVPVYTPWPGRVAGVTGLPTQLGSLDALRVLHVSDTQLMASLPTELARLPNLIFMYSSSSNMTGVLPTQLGSMHRLQYLHLDGNSISGTIPVELGDATNLGRVDLEGNPLSGSLPNMFDKFTHLELWNTFGCNLHTSDPPPSVRSLGRRMMHFEFFVQDEQLEVLADFRCARRRFGWQSIARGGKGTKINYVPRFAHDYERYVGSRCPEQTQPGGLDAQFEHNFGPGERFANGVLKPGQRIYHGFDSDVYARSAPVSGIKFKKEDGWLLTGDPGAFNWEEDEDGDGSPPTTTGIPIPLPPPGNRRRWDAEPH